MRQRNQRHLLTVFLLLLCMVTIGCQPQGSLPAANPQKPVVQLTTEEKLKDFEALYKVLQENYPFFEVNKRMNGVDWLANKEGYLEKIQSTKSDEEFFYQLKSILSDLYNGHTGPLEKEYYKPFKAAYEENARYNKPWVEQFNSPQAVVRYGGDTKAVNTSTASNEQQQNYTMPDNVATKILSKNQVAYLAIHSLNMFNIEGDMKLIRPFLESIKDYKALVIDIRGNGGGSDSYWSNNLVPMMIDKSLSWNTYFVYRGGEFSMPFINQKLINNMDELQPIEKIREENLKNAPPELLKDYKYFYKSNMVVQPKDSVGFKGKIYLLVDRRVYSSSEAFASFAKNTGFATLVGETTGGDGIGQDPLVYALPNSGYIVRFPMVMGLTADGNCNEEHKTQPDIALNAEMTQDISKDAAIQYVLNQYK